VTRDKARVTILLILSLLAVFWLQPSLPIRYLDFWLPTATLGIVSLSWVISASPEQKTLRANWLTGLLLGGVILLVGLTRLLPSDYQFTASRPPQTTQVILVLGLMTLSTLALGRWRRPAFLTIGICLLIGFLLVQKTPALGELISAAMRRLSGQSPELATPFDIRWLGFSYLTFRIIHTLRDRQAGRLPDVSLAEYVTYILFFPAITAGPIDRIERFTADLRRPLALSQANWLDAGTRFFTGLFKKFVIADSLALISLNNTNAAQVLHPFWAWVLLYAYALQIYFDFSGYTDMVIGLARLLGINLPENFNAPYLKPNLTQFWSNWHMSLTQWFRAYYFNPVNRWLRKLKRPPSTAMQILIMQVSTMVLIGIWHGVTWNFIFWGLWHGLGLFIHNRWSNYAKPRAADWAKTPARQQLFNLGGIFLTFNFVALGWVFFALSTPAISAQFLMKLLGIN
jgi:alginate O-acetyltransferase complex protein AlgI